MRFWVCKILNLSPARLRRHVVTVLSNEKIGVLEAGVGARQPRSGYTESVSREVAVGNRSLLQVPLELDDTPPPPPPPPPVQPTEPQGWVPPPEFREKLEVLTAIPLLCMSLIFP